MTYTVLGMDLVSTSSTGSPGNGASMVPQFSPDGTKVVFSSATTAATWGSGNTFASDIFMKDLTTGVLTPISVNSAGAFGNGNSTNASFSDDGTKIVFESLANNLLGVGNDTNTASDIFVYDIATATITRVSTDASGAQATGGSFRAFFTPDGDVIFGTSAPLAGASDTGGFFDIYHKDLSTGAVTRLSTTSTGTQINSTSSMGTITQDGTKLGFLSSGTNVTGGTDTNGSITDLFIKDLSTGVVTYVNTTAAGVQGNNPVSDYNISSDGTKVVFTSTATNLVGSDFNLSSDIFLKDLVTGDIQIISKSTAEVLGNGASSSASFSADGTKVIFSSLASNLVAGDTNNTSDIFIKDLITGEVSRISTSTSGVQGNNFSDRAVFSPVDNTKIAFESAASNLTSTDTNGTIYDVFVANVNASPIAVDDYIVVEEGAVTANLVPVLTANDIDSDTGDMKTIVSVDTSLTLGSVTFDEATQTLIYTLSPTVYGLPDGQNAGDLFSYTVADIHGVTSTATVYISVQGVDNPPETNDDFFSLNIGDNSGNIYLAVLSNDTDPELNTFNISSVDSTGTLGTVTFNSSTNSLVYTADPDAFPGLFLGDTATDTFTYTVTDTTGKSSTATVTVTIAGTEEPNAAPEANDDSTSVNENANTGNIAPLMLSNDSDPDAGDSITITAVNSTGLIYGTVSFDSSTQSVIYSANTSQADALAEGETAVDVFTYSIEDENGDTDVASVTVTITGANDAPVAVNDALDLNSGSSTSNIATLVLGNDTDLDNGDTKEISAVDTTGTIGTVTFDESTQTLSYSATGFESLADGETATDTFTYTVIDSNGATSSATVTVTVTGSNDGPVAVLDVVNVNEDTTTANIIPLMLSNDSDADNGDNITVTSIDDSGLSYGEITFDQASQSLVYNANNANSLGAGQTANDEFSYTITDGTGETSTATVTVVVTGTNDDPDANNDATDVDLGATTTNIAGLLLSNDTDVDTGDTRTITAVDTAGTLGTVIFDEATQTLTYSADNAAFPGLAQGASTTDTFTYTITDSQGATSTATVTMTINRPDVNDAPVANNDAVNVNEDATTANLAATLLANDSDDDASDSLSIVSVDGSSLTLGSIAFDQTTQSVVYSADQNAADSLAAGETANESFTYTIQDESGETSTATVTVTVTGVNDAPKAEDDASNVDNGATTGNLVSTLLANDTDVDNGDTRTISAVNTTGTLGTVSFDEATQTLTYTANPSAFPGLGAGDTATDTFTYTIVDSEGATSTATVTMTVNGVDFNDAPVAVDDNVNVNEDTSTGNLAATLLSNDTDGDNDTLSITSVDDSGLTLGSITFDQATQSVIYNANNANSLAVGETAVESFTYTLEDPSGETSTATVNVTVTGVNDAPTATNDGAAVNSGATTANLVATLLANDTDPDTSDVLTVSAVDTTGTLGSVAFDEATQSLTYTAGAAFASLGAGQTTTDTFSYTASDGNGGTSIATVTVTITGGNDGPTANDDAVSVNEDASTANIASLLLSNDTDLDTGDTLTITSVDTTTLTLGTVAFDEATQSVVYSANNANSLAVGQTATESFTYTIEDASGATSTATVDVTVTGINDAPVAVNDGVAANAGTTTANLVATLLGNDTDIDTGDTLTVSAVDTTGTQGAVAFDEATQSLTYTAGAAFASLGAGQTATDTFTYTADDGNGGTSIATVTVTVTGANDGPNANDDSVNVNEDASTANLASLLLSNDTDADNDTLTITSVDASALTLGTVAFDEATQSVVYSANNANSLAAGATAVESFTYTVEDGNGGTSTATVAVTVTGVNDAPVAVNDGVAINAGTTTANLVATLLGNDTDVDAGDTKAIASVDTTGTQGTVNFDESTQSLTYTAAASASLAAGETATDTFTYTMVDGSGATSTATVTVTVTGANDGPTANDDAVSVNEDASTANLASLLLSNDADPDTGDTLTITSVDTSGLALGTVNFDESTQSVVYSANNANSLAAGATAVESFSYTVEDEAGATSTATVNVTVTGVNDAPVAIDDASNVDLGSTTTNLVSTLLANDTDVDAGDTRTISAVNTTGTLGTVTFDEATQSLTYEANPAAFPGLGSGDTATDTFTYTIKDASGATSTATVTMTITGTNDAPVAADDTVNVNEDASTGNLATLLLSNDSDDDILHISSVDSSSLSYGSVLFDEASQSVVYTADNANELSAGATATESFTYTLEDESGETSTATVNVTITGVNDAPEANSDGAAVTAGNTTANLASLLLGNDTDIDSDDTLTIGAVDTTGTLGTVTFNEATQSLTYTAGTAFASLGAGQTTTDTFSYTVSDGNGGTDTATVTVTVTGVNDGPTAVNDTVSVNEDATTGNLVSTLLANDTDPDAGDTKSIVSVNAGSTTYGTVSFNAGTQTLTYAADKALADTLGVGQTATDTFTYTIRDAAGATSTATVNVTVTGVNDGPAAVNDAFNVNEDATTANLVSQILANDTDVDTGDTKRISTVNATGLVYGTVTFNEATQSLTYAANKNAADALGIGDTAADTFTYTMRDAAGATSTATVTMTIQGINDAPIANDDAFNVMAGTPLIINIADLLANDSDIDGTFDFDDITVNSTKGTIVNNGDGTLTYTANSGYTGADSFTYSVEDNNGATDTAKVNLTVLANGKYIKGTDKNDTLKGGTGNDTIEGGKDKGSVTVTKDSFFLGTKTSEKLVGNDTDTNSSTIGWQKAWGQYTPLFQITAVGIGETEATGYKYTTAIPSFANATGNVHENGIGVDGKANKGGTFQQEIGYDPISKTSEKLVFDAQGEIINKAAFDLSYFYSKANGADKLGSTKYSEVGYWEVYRDGVLVGQGDFVAGVADSNISDGDTLSAIGSGNNESLLTIDFTGKGGFDKVVLSAKQYDGLNANQSAAAGKPLGTAKAEDSSDFMVRNVKFDMAAEKFTVKVGDHLFGGAGNDTFIFNKGHGVDAIHDFTDGGDIIRTNYKITDVVTGFGTDTLIFKNGTVYEAVVAVDNGHTWDQSDFIFAV